MLAATLLFLPGTLCDARVWSQPYQALCPDWSYAFVDYRFELLTPKQKHRVIEKRLQRVRRRFRLDLDLDSLIKIVNKRIEVA